MEDVKEIDFNEILEKHVGGWGRYQWQYLFVFALVPFLSTFFKLKKKF
jgi:hypothetical protein